MQGSVTKGLGLWPHHYSSLFVGEHKATLLLYFQVETIGDAYMGASGLPIRNGIQDVDEIATMSLRFLSATVHFQIGHVPEEKPRIRNGIHTGSQPWWQVALWSRYGSRWFWIQVLSLTFLGPGNWMVASFEGNRSSLHTYFQLAGLLGNSKDTQRLQGVKPKVRRRPKSRTVIPGYFPPCLCIKCPLIWSGFCQTHGQVACAKVTSTWLNALLSQFLSY